MYYIYCIYAITQRSKCFMYHINVMTVVMVMIGVSRRGRNNKNNTYSIIYSSKSVQLIEAPFAVIFMTTIPSIRVSIMSF